MWSNSPGFRDRIHPFERVPTFDEGIAVLLEEFRDGDTFPASLPSYFGLGVRAHRLKRR